MTSIDERLGPRWAADELQAFFLGKTHLAYKRYGKDWIQIEQSLAKACESGDLDAPARTHDMIKALYFMNKTYLGLGTANAQDFAAIMSDHYRYLCEGKLDDEDEDEDSRSKQTDEELLASQVYETRKPAYKSKGPRKPIKRQYETIEITSSLSYFQFPSVCPRKTCKGPLNSFPELLYSNQQFLVDYCQSLRPIPVSAKFVNWCKCEWFYSYVDKGFFQLNEFMDCVKGLGVEVQEAMPLSHWRTIRHVLGKPRRFSTKFISEERRRLKKYREAVKVLQQGKVLPPDYHDLLPYLNLTPGNVTPKLMVGTKVLAVHPRTKEVRSGSILTLDATKYHVQFDLPELGVCLISDTQLAPAYGEDQPDSPSSAGFVFQPRVLSDRDQSFPSMSGEKFKAGVNIYAMAFLLKLLERKEALLELLKRLNDYCQAECRKDGAWRPASDFQQQYAWIVSSTQCVCIQAINTAIAPVLEVFRLRSSVPDHPVRIEPRRLVKKPLVFPTQNERLESLRLSAAAVMAESQREIDEKTDKLLPQEQQKLKEFVKSSLVLLSLLDGRDKDEQGWSYVEEALAQLTPVCESNKELYDRIRTTVTGLKEKVHSVPN